MKAAPDTDATITLRPVDRRNWVACGRLVPRADQAGYVAGNLETIAESAFEPHYRLRAICRGEEVVGMLAYCHETEPEDPRLYWLFRLMIGVSFQGRGYASAAVTLAIAEMRDLGATRILTMCKPANTAASALYRKLGFAPTGETLDDGDPVLELGVAITGSPDESMGDTASAHRR